MYFNVVGILAVISALIINYGISKKISLLGFLIWFGISFLIIWGVFALFNFLF